MKKKNKIVKVRLGLYNRPCRVRIVDVAGDDVMVEQSNGHVSIVDIGEIIYLSNNKKEKIRDRSGA